MRWLLVLGWRRLGTEQDAAATAQQFSREAAALPGLRAHVGWHLPGSYGPGDLSLTLRLPDDRDPAEQPELVALLARWAPYIHGQATALPLVPVRGAGGMESPASTGGIHRVLLIALTPGAGHDDVELLEHTLAGLPRHVPAIGPWTLHRIPTRQDRPYQLSFEHTMPSTADLSMTSAYMRHPYHPTLVDGLFDPANPRCVVDHFAHTYWRNGGAHRLAGRRAT